MQELRNLVHAIAANPIKEEENIVFINKIEYGNNKTKNAKKLEKMAEREEEDEEE